MMKKVILITGHYWLSQRKAGFHWLADAFWQLGWEVTFLTVGISYLSFLKNDYRLKYPVLKEANQFITVHPNFYSYVYFTPWHPANLRLNALNDFSKSLFSRYAQFIQPILKKKITEANLFIFESTPGILLFDYFKSLKPTANYIYRVSDDLKLLKNHPLVLKKEVEISSHFDLISVPSQSIYRKFQNYKQCYLHGHGITKEAFNWNLTSPYKDQQKVNAVFVGNSYLDYDFLEIASQIFPQWNFHVIGNFSPLYRSSNLIYYGELPFAETIPYLIHGDIGLQIRKYASGIESLSDSLKVIQYTYCQLPIVAPDYIKSSRKHFFYYSPNDPQSIKTALIQADSYPKETINTEGIYSWKELALELLDKI